MKKIIHYTRFIVLSFLIIGFTGCEKDNLNLLTDGVWKFSNMSTDNADNAIIQIVAGMKAIRTDAKLQFLSDNTYSIDAPLYLEDGTWNLVGSSQLVFTITGAGVSTASIDNLTKKELKYIETFVDVDGNPFSVTTKWVK